MRDQASVDVARRARWTEALDLAGRYEQRSRLTRAFPWRTFRVGGAYAVRRGASLDGLPETVREDARRSMTTGVSIRAHCRAEVVRIGKFDVDQMVRLRAFHAVDGAWTVLGLQGFDDPKAPGMVRAVRAREQVAVHAPSLAPPLLDHGTDPEAGVAFIREGGMLGRHPANLGEVQAAAGSVVERLVAVHHGVGIERRRLHEVSAPELLTGWDACVRAYPVEERVSRRVRALVERDAWLDVSLVHGDLVGSNMVLPTSGAKDDIVLIDWEHARERYPIAFDVGKLHVQARHPDRILTLLQTLLGPVLGSEPDSYSLEEQLALGHVQMLSWHVHREARAEQAGRLPQFEKASRRRLARVVELLT